MAARARTAVLREICVQDRSHGTLRLRKLSTASAKSRRAGPSAFELRCVTSSFRSARPALPPSDCEDRPSSTPSRSCPAGSMRKVLRLAMVMAPKWPSEPYSSTTLWSGSASRWKVRPSLVQNCLWLSGVSTLTPRITAFVGFELGQVALEVVRLDGAARWSCLWDRSRAPPICRGSSSSEIGAPVCEGSVKVGAACPTVGIVSLSAWTVTNETAASTSAAAKTKEAVLFTRNLRLEWDGEYERGSMDSG